MYSPGDEEVNEMAEEKNEQKNEAPEKPAESEQQETAAGQAGGQETAAEAEGAAQAEAAAAGAQEGQEQPAPADVYDLLRFTLGIFLNQAWIHLGVRAAPGTTETVTDLPKARVAIDTAVAIYEKLKPTLSDAECREIELELTNLRLNFARRA